MDSTGAADELASVVVNKRVSPVVVVVIVVAPLRSVVPATVTLPLNAAVVSLIVSSEFPDAVTVNVVELTAAFVVPEAIEVVDTADTESSTYFFVEASVSALGAAKLIILFEATLMLPVPDGSNVRSALDGEEIVDPVADKSPNVAGTLVKLVPSPANAVAVTVPDTCNVVDGSEVPIPTREFVTSRYSRFVSNARSVPFRVKFAFRTDPDIRPMAILGAPYNNVSKAYALHSLFIIAG
tara:strand:+ start:298 stop:1014 length:717 start_codon:yes stop_codon:yes gene_type:complete